MRCFLVHLVVAGLLSGPTIGSAAQAVAPATLGVKAAVAEVEGVYRWRADLNRYVYSEKRALAVLLGRWAPQAAVLELVECLDDVAPSRSVLEGTPVMTGVVCHESLTQLVYHEPSSKETGASRQWKGDISPKASPEQLMAAKKAWKGVIKAKRHIFL